MPSLFKVCASPEGMDTGRTCLHDVFNEGLALIRRRPPTLAGTNAEPVVHALCVGIGCWPAGSTGPVPSPAMVDDLSLRHEWTVAAV